MTIDIDVGAWLTIEIGSRAPGESGSRSRLKFRPLAGARWRTLLIDLVGAFFHVWTSMIRTTRSRYLAMGRHRWRGIEFCGGD